MANKMTKWLRRRRAKRDALRKLEPIHDNLKSCCAEEGMGLDEISELREVLKARRREYREEMAKEKEKLRQLKAGVK